MTTTAYIPGIHCDACAMLIKDVSSDFPAIQQVDVDIDAKTVTLTHDESFDIEAWKNEVESLDEKYKVTSIS